MAPLILSICTRSHIAQACAMFASYKRQLSAAKGICLIQDAAPEDFQAPDGLQFVGTEWLSGEEWAESMLAKYPRNSDALRWALKPAMMRKGLEYAGQVFWCDNDLWFVSDPAFLSQMLGDYRFLLSPHNRIADPGVDAGWFRTNFKDGVFNAGFVAARTEAKDILLWWEKATAHACEINFAEGLYVDQKYLDLLPALFEGVGIIRHPGCNIAWWNRNDSVRCRVEGELRINGKWPPVFLHATRDTLDAAVDGRDPFLKDMVSQYLNELAGWRRQLSLS